MAEETKKVLNRLMERVEKMAEGMTKEEAATPDRVESLPTTNVVSPQDLVQDIEMEVDVDDNVDVFLEELREEVLLQSLLHKRMSESRERHFECVHRNGKRLLVVCPPESQSASTFHSEAKRTGWIDAMLDTEEKRSAMMSCLAEKSPDAFHEVAKKKKASSIDLATTETMAFARVGGLNTSRLRDCRSYLKLMANVNLKLSEKEVQEIDEEVGASRAQHADFGVCACEWAEEKGKGKDKKPAETVECWTSSLMDEVCAEVDVYLRNLHNEGDNKATEIPTIDYEASGFPTSGVTVLIGGDHGQKNCPISCKINLSPPKRRKELGKLGHHCPIVQFASLLCTKDACSLLNNTVVPKVASEIKKLQTSSILTVYDKNNRTTRFRSHCAPDSVELVAFARDGERTKVTCAHTTKPEAGSDANIKAAGHITLSKEPSAVPIADLSSKVVISRFNDLYMGDLAFLCLSLGMVNSDGDWCTMCHLLGSEFNCEPDKMQPRTRETLRLCLEKYLVEYEKKSHTKNPPANCKGVNSPMLVNIDPSRIIVPILHCPMGLVDKTLESFQQFVNYNVEALSPELDAIRLEYHIANKQFETSCEAFEEAERMVKEAATSSPGLNKLLTTARKARADARVTRNAIKERLDSGLKKHNSRSTSLKQKFEKIYKLYAITREHYHGGKFNGVNCIRIVEAAHKLFIGDDKEKGGFLEQCPLNKQDRASDDYIRKWLIDYEIVFGMMDAIWSKARGVEGGLLPSDEDVQFLSKALRNCKAHWMKMGLTTKQPKWHLTFDGHLEEQYKTYGGLADKADDSIEAFHQTLMKLRERFRGSKTYKQKETSIRRELRRRSSARIQAHIDEYQRRLKKPVTSKRSVEAKERQENKKKLKREKREAYVG